MAQSNLDEKRKNMVTRLLFVVVGQVGFITLIVLAVLIAGGVWLDNYFGTKPTITFILSLVGIPLSVFLMFLSSRRALARFTEQYEAEKKKNSA
ncbi:MAG: AtpZ/AtpI family protein [Anaerolineales bacterium]|nr:AtpZ/AtpI family protein [Anaerolineales bacterium]